MKAQTDPPPDKPAAGRSADSAATAQDARPVSAEERARVIKGLCGRHYSGGTAVDARIADEIRAAEAAAEARGRASAGEAQGAAAPPAPPSTPAAPDPEGGAK